MVFTCEDVTIKLNLKKKRNDLTNSERQHQGFDQIHALVQNFHFHICVTRILEVEGMLM